MPKYQKNNPKIHKAQDELRNDLLSEKEFNSEKFVSKIVGAVSNEVAESLSEAFLGASYSQQELEKIINLPLIKAVEQDNALTEQQKKTAKIGLILLVWHYQKYYFISFTITVTMLILGIIFWPFLILSFILLVWWLIVWSNIKKVAGIKFWELVRIETKKLGGESVVNKETLQKELPKAITTEIAKKAIIRRTNFWREFENVAGGSDKVWGSDEASDALVKLTMELGITDKEFKEMVNKVSGGK